MLIRDRTGFGFYLLKGLPSSKKQNLIVRKMLSHSLNQFIKKGISPLFYILSGNSMPNNAIPRFITFPTVADKVSLKSRFSTSGTLKTEWS
jgi:hypothetical protein